MEASSLHQGQLNRVLLILSYFFLCAIQLSTSHIVDIYMESLVNRCLDGKHHKTKPGPEADLFKQVSLQIDLNVILHTLHLTLP